METSGGKLLEKNFEVQNTRSVTPMVSERRVAPRARTHDRGGGGVQIENFKAVGGKIHQISRQWGGRFI